jgi:hypothetical protein
MGIRKMEVLTTGKPGGPRVCWGCGGPSRRYVNAESCEERPLAGNPLVSVECALRRASGPEGEVGNRGHQGAGAVGGH